jgi:hypothetical protein
VGWLQPRFSLACGATSDLKIALGYAKARLNDVELRQGTAVVTEQPAFLKVDVEGECVSQRGCQGISCQLTAAAQLRGAQCIHCSSLQTFITE